MTRQRSFRLGFGLVAALCSGAASYECAHSEPATGQVAQLKASPPPSDAQPASGATKTDDQPQKNDRAVPSGSAAVPSTAHDGRAAKEGNNGERPDRGTADKGKGPPAKGLETPAIRMKDLGPVDTRVTVPPQPPRSGDKKQNPPPRTTTGLRLLPPHLRRLASPPARNSIGVALPSPAQPTARTPSQGANLPVTNPRSGEATGQPPVGPRNATLSPPPSHPLSAPPVVPRSALNGTGIVRSSDAPATLGGPGRSLTGINGTTIRPKH